MEIKTTNKVGTVFYRNKFDGEIYHKCLCCGRLYPCTSQKIDQESHLQICEECFNKNVATDKK